MQKESVQHTVPTHSSSDFKQKGWFLVVKLLDIAKQLCSNSDSRFNVQEYNWKNLKKYELILKDTWQGVYNIWTQV